MSHNDFSKIVELIDIKQQLRAAKDDHGMEMTQRTAATNKFEEELKRLQMQIRTLRSYINDGQKKMDGFPSKYLPMLQMKDQKIAEMAQAIERLNTELRKVGRNPV